MGSVLPFSSPPFVGTDLRFHPPFTFALASPSLFPFGPHTQASKDIVFLNRRVWLTACQGRCQASGRYAASDDGGDMTFVALRTASDSITRATPLMIRLTPTSVPIAQAELDGHCM